MKDSVLSSALFKDLSEGFPDFSPPKHVTDALADVAKEENILLHQYTRGFVNTCTSNLNDFGCNKRLNKGHPRLIQAVSKLYSNAIGRTIDPFTEILVTGGAFEGVLIILDRCFSFSLITVLSFESFVLFHNGMCQYR